VETIKFNVFGKLMSVLRKEQQWQLFSESDTGLRSRVYDVMIPNDIELSDMATYLDDIYHEYSSDKHPHVIKLD